MATYYEPNRVEKIVVTLNVTLANGYGQKVREMTFTDERNGSETVIQLADLLLSACDLACATAQPNPPGEGREPQASVPHREG